MLSLATPDITPAQIVALLTFIVGQLVAYAVIGPKTGQLVLSIVSAIVPLGIAIADAIIRHGRAHAVAAVATSTGAGSAAGT